MEQNKTKQQSITTEGTSHANQYIEYIHIHETIQQQLFKYSNVKDRFPLYRFIRHTLRGTSAFTATMPEQEQSRRLKRQIGVTQGIALICGVIIGSGIFISPQAVIRYSGSVSTSLLLWAVGGFISTCGALSFVELGTTFPASGERYEYLRVMYGRDLVHLWRFCIYGLI